VRRPKKEARPKDRAPQYVCTAIYSENAKKQWLVRHLKGRFLPGRRRKPGRGRTAGQPGFASSVVDLHKRYSKVL
jgi:hypothetical protein